MDFSQSISTQLNVHPGQVSAAIELLDAGNTIPFIARYRKEATGLLDEVQIRSIGDLLGKLRSLDERRQTVLKTIEDQGKLTPELKAQIQAAPTLTALEDLYQPYRPKRHTRASIAREKGLQGLADLILKQIHTRQTPSQIVAPFLTEQVPSEEEAWSGARDIVSETISEHAEVRRLTREKAHQWGILRSEKITTSDKSEPSDERGVYQSYYQFDSLVNRIKAYQVLAIIRGETEKVLRVHLEITERDWKNAVGTVFPTRPNFTVSKPDGTSYFRFG